MRLRGVTLLTGLVLAGCGPAASPGPGQDAQTASAAPAAPQTVAVPRAVAAPQAATVRPTPMTLVPPAPVFRTTSGGTLDGTLRDWAKGQGWTVLVRTRRVWDIAAAADFPGDFKEAASGLVRALATAVPAPVATFYANRVLVITSQDVTDD